MPFPPHIPDGTWIHGLRSIQARLTLQLQNIQSEMEYTCRIIDEQTQSIFMLRLRLINDHGYNPVTQADPPAVTPGVRSILIRIARLTASRDRKVARNRVHRYQCGDVREELERVAEVMKNEQKRMEDVRAWVGVWKEEREVEEEVRQAVKAELARTGAVGGVVGEKEVAVCRRWRYAEHWV